jgi:hypothetical protein
MGIRMTKTRFLLATAASAGIAVSAAATGQPGPRRRHRKLLDVRRSRQRAGRHGGHERRQDEPRRDLEAMMRARAGSSSARSRAAGATRSEGLGAS